MDIIWPVKVVGRAKLMKIRHQTSFTRSSFLSFVFKSFFFSSSSPFTQPLTKLKVKKKKTKKKKKKSWGHFQLASRAAVIVWKHLHSHCPASNNGRKAIAQHFFMIERKKSSTLWWQSFNDRLCCCREMHSTFQQLSTCLWWRLNWSVELLLRSWGTRHQWSGTKVINTWLK